MEYWENPYGGFFACMMRPYGSPHHRGCGDGPPSGAKTSAPSGRAPTALSWTRRYGYAACERADGREGHGAGRWRILVIRDWSSVPPDGGEPGILARAMAATMATRHASSFDWVYDDCTCLVDPHREIRRLDSVLYAYWHKTATQARRALASKITTIWRKYHSRNSVSLSLVETIGEFQPGFTTDSVE